MPDAAQGALIPLARDTVDGEVVQTVDARALHAFLGVRRDFTTWMRAMVAKYGFAQGVDFVTTLLPNLGEKGHGRPTTEFHLTLDTAKQLSMVANTAKGGEARRYFIECERRSQAAPSIPAALSDPVTLRALLLGFSEREIALQAAVEAQRPALAALERLAVADGSLSRTEAAKVLQVRRKDLIGHMRERRWTYQRAGSRDEVGYQDKVAGGLLEHKTTLVEHPGGERAHVQVRITPKGLAALARELGANVEAAA